MTLDAKTIRSVRRLTKTVRTLETQVADMARASQARDRSWEAGQVQLVDADGVVRGLIGEQPDGTFASVAVNGPMPPIPSAPTVDTTHPGVMTVAWDGLTADGSAWPADFDRVRVHVDTLPGILPTDENEITAWHTTSGGTATLALDEGATYVALSAVSTSGTASLPSAEVSATVGAAIGADVAPTVSPTPTVAGGIDVLRVNWSELSPPVEVHISTNPAFVPTLGDPATLVTNADTAVTLTRLPSGQGFSYAVLYYVRLIAYNNAGAAPPSDVGSASPVPGDLQLNDGGTTRTSRLIVTSTHDVTAQAGNEPPVRIGDIAGRHIRIDGNEIMGIGTAGAGRARLGIQGGFVRAWNFAVTTVNPSNTTGTARINHGLSDGLVGLTPSTVLVGTNVDGVTANVIDWDATTFQVIVRDRDGTLRAANTGIYWLALNG